MATEFEIKLRAGNVRQLEKILKDPQVAGHALEKLREIHMKTTYYDTADGALTARRWMLRVRQENEKSVVTMKTPGVGYARGEWECEGDSPEAAIETLIGRGGRAAEAERTGASNGLRRIVYPADPAAAAEREDNVRDLRRRRRAAGWEAPRAVLRAGAGAFARQRKRASGVFPGAGFEIFPRRRAKKQICPRQTVGGWKII